ncbi:VF530 family protein [Alteromonadaceae bacterium BrNp21-10]|nr:VF530 family protein [Alteromonadaceae bacterium BrNp21-10]
MQKNNPLHGVTLKKIVEDLESHYGWQKLATLVAIRCFESDPSVKSSLTFLRRTPWAREKVEELYVSTINSPWYQAPGEKND